MLKLENICHADKSNLDDIMKIYEYARAFMRKSGNAKQWSDNRPSRDVLMRDITNHNCYVYAENGVIKGVFCFIIGEDETYKTINGKWNYNLKYGTIHRLASDGTLKGFANMCLDYCSTKINYLRADTHQDNKIMQHIFASYGFKECGIIHVDDGTERIAYDLLNKID